jgi:hypothetical protein
MESDRTLRKKVQLKVSRTTTIHRLNQGISEFLLIQEPYINLAGYIK